MEELKQIDMILNDNQMTPEDKIETIREVVIDKTDFSRPDAFKEEARKVFDNLNREDLDQINEVINKQATSLGVNPQEFSMLGNFYGRVHAFFKGNDKEVIEASHEMMMTIGTLTGQTVDEETLDPNEIQEIHEIFMDAKNQIDEVIE